jgi:hypothetical protein
MSLDIHLIGPEKEVKCECPNCSDIHTRTDRERYFDTNITHNLGKMASEAGIYYALWRPDEPYPHKAKDITTTIERGLELMKSDPDKFRAFSAENGWGTYEQFIPWIEEYLKALKEYPEADIEVSR